MNRIEWAVSMLLVAVVLLTHVERQVDYVILGALAMYPIYRKIAQRYFSRRRSVTIRNNRK